MIYTFYFSDGAGPKTGLSPTLDIFVKVSDGTSAGTPPTVTELSGGFYKFTYAATYDVAIRIDSNDATMAGVDRYISMVASPHDDDLDAAISGRAPANEYDSELTAIQVDLDDPSQYKANVSALATSTEVAKVGKKVDRNFAVG